GLVSVMHGDTTTVAERPAAKVDLAISNSTPLSQDLTRTGSVMGTPTYMAPEQFDGQVATARADQFAFCIALHEALYGERPFRGSTFEELAVNVTTGRMEAPPKRADVPGWLRRAVMRGLARDP